MNHEPRFDDLIDDELEHVSGGMTCQQGQIASKVYSSLSDIYTSLGMHQDAAVYYGMASGVKEGAC